MQHAVRQALQSVQCAALVQVSMDTRNAQTAQIGAAQGIPRNSDHVNAAFQQQGDSQTDITASNDEKPLSAKTGWQCASSKMV